MRRRSHNQHLRPLPPDRAFLQAVADIQASGRKWDLYGGASAQDIAWKLDVQGASRLGNGAVKGSWSGNMVPGLRVFPRLRSLAHRGLLREFRGERRQYFILTEEGRKVLTDA
jgi:hypothetical protein